MRLYSEIFREIRWVVVEILRCRNLAFWCVFGVANSPVWPTRPWGTLTNLRLNNSRSNYNVKLLPNLTLLAFSTAIQRIAFVDTAKVRLNQVTVVATVVVRN